MLPEVKRDWIMDLYNEGGYEVYTKNTEDDDDCLEWLEVGIGIVACYIIGEIKIIKYRVRKKCK